MKLIDRVTLLQQLDAIRSGVEPRDSVPQSSCFIFKDGHAYTGNDEVICRVPCDLDITGAIPAKPLLELLSKLKEETLTVMMDGTKLSIKGKNNITQLNVESEILAPLHEQGFPTKFKKLPSSFIEGVKTTSRCVGSDANEYLTMCIHITAEYMEALDNSQLCRFSVPLKAIKRPFLVKGTDLKPVLNMDPQGYALTEEWMFFKNTIGAVFGCRADYANQYPDLSSFLEMKGTGIKLPQGLTDAIGKAEIFTSELTDNNRIEIMLRDQKLRVRGIGASGKYQETRKVKYDGEPLGFRINPQLLTYIAEQHNSCEITSQVIKMHGPDFTYVSVLQEL